VFITRFNTRYHMVMPLMHIYMPVWSATTPSINSPEYCQFENRLFAIQMHAAYT